MTPFQKKLEEFKLARLRRSKARNVTDWQKCADEMNKKFYELAAFPDDELAEGDFDALRQAEAQV